MAAVDQFEPHWSVVECLIEEILEPELKQIFAQTSEQFVARIAVWVRQQEIPKFSITSARRDEFDVEENVDVRLRFQRTLNPERHRFSIQAHFAENWRRNLPAQLHVTGDIDTSGKWPRFRVLRSSTSRGRKWGR